ncbi:hypothetical protein RJ639_026849 [Escallonia herrerae]|uniref:Cytochrome P450 n=1 Tax=Escallonia herrerae TaxID=1293975 RepID=A0AA88X6Z1_9ASTE|nr:hypothetical protein RJ639_026849 [Escallonia herrerae]
MITLATIFRVFDLDLGKGCAEELPCRKNVTVCVGGGARCVCRNGCLAVWSDVGDGVAGDKIGYCGTHNDGGLDGRGCDDGMEGNGMARGEYSQKHFVASITLVTLLLVIWAFRKLRHGRTRLPPGPCGLPLLGYLPFLGTNLHRSFAELARVHGPIFKIWLGSKLCVVLSSPAVIKEVVREQDRTFANRDPTVAALIMSHNASDIVFAPDGSTWRMLRKVLVHEMLSNRNLDACYMFRRHEVRKIVIDVYSKVSTPIDIGQLAFLTVFNATTSMLWGGTPEGNEWSISFGAEFRAAVSAFSVLMEKPNISDFFPSLARFDIQGIEKETKKISLWVEQIFDSLLEQRMEVNAAKRMNATQKDFVQSLLELRDQQGSGSSITLKHMKSLLLDIVAAGTDTVSAMSEWVMGELMRHPKVMQKLCEELTSVVGLNDIVEEFHIPKLKYLEAVVKETHRLHPAAPFLVPRSPSQTSTVGGYTIPKGTKVLVNVWAMQRDPQIWDRPLDFQPERFLSKTEKVDYSGNNFMYLPFGSGRRICAGLPLAERMLTYVLATFLHSFEWKLPFGTELDLSDKFGLVTKKSTPLVLVPTPSRFLVHIDVGKAEEGNGFTATRPPWLASTWLLPFLGTNLLTSFTKLARCYGPIYKIWLGNKLCIVVSSPSLAKEVLRDKDTTFANRNPSIAALAVTYGARDIIWSSYGSSWRTLRKLFVREMMNNTNLGACCNLRKDEVRKTIRDISSKVGSPMDIGQLTFLTEINVVMSMLWGATLEGQKISMAGAEFREVVSGITDLVMKPNLSDFFPILARFDIQGVEQQMKRLFQRIETIFDGVLDERVKLVPTNIEGTCNNNGRKDFLQILMELKEQELASTSISMTQIKAILVVSWFDNRGRCDRRDRYNSNHGRVVDGRNNAQSRRDEKVVKETLRLHPPAPLLVPRRPSESCTVGGYTIPKNSRVLVNVCAIHVDPNVWDNPSEFKPERFLCYDTTRYDYTGSNFHVLPFGSGRRICPGIPLAEKMVMYLLASLLHSFQWHLPRDEVLDLSENFGIVLKKRTPLIATPSQRLSNMELVLACRMLLRHCFDRQNMESSTIPQRSLGSDHDSVFYNLFSRYDHRYNLQPLGMVVGM